MPEQQEKKKKESSLTDKVDLLITLIETFQDDLSQIEEEVKELKISNKKISNRLGL